MNISFNPAARQEFADAATWYAEGAGEARAIDFRNEAQRSLRLINMHPSIGAPSAGDTRRLVIRRYPYSIIYRIDSSHLRVLAIASDRRRPGYWAGRR